MNAARYAVKNSKTGQFFAGFGKNNEVIWADIEQNARAFGSRLDAQCQASLFRAMDVPAQRKPVAL